MRNNGLKHSGSYGEDMSDGGQSLEREIRALGEGETEKDVSGFRLRH